MSKLQNQSATRFNILCKHLDVRPQDMVSPLVIEYIKDDEQFNAKHQIQKEIGLNSQESQRLVLKIRADIRIEL